MTERPPGLDDLLGHVAAHLETPCEHRGGTWFDRTICREPCGAMHTCCTDCGEPIDTCALQEIRVPTPGDHRPMLVHWDNRHTLPAEVCDTCSDPDSGTWVPVPFCEKARLKLVADPDCSYSYGVIQRADEDR